MAKLRIPMKLITTGMTAKWVICEPSESARVQPKEVLIPVNEFKRLVAMTNDIDELAQLVMDYEREEALNGEYNKAVAQIISNNWIED